jgi:hypothetical protein
MVDGTVMRKIEIAFGQRFLRPRVGDFRLVSVQLIFVTQIELVYENR